MDSFQTKPAPLCLFLSILFLGAIFALIVFDYSAGLCFSRANADLRYTQSETPSTLQPQSVWLRGLLCQSTDSSFNLQSFTSMKHAQSKMKKSVYTFWNFILVLCDKSPCPIPPNLTIKWDGLCPRVSVSTSSISARCYITVLGRRERTGWKWFLRKSCFRKHYARSYDWGSYFL